MERYDVVVVGGGPAGLSAALWLGRYRRRTLVVDAGEQRNLAAESTHGYLTFDRCSPQEFLERGRSDVAAYPEVTLHTGRVTAIERTDDGFVVTAEDSEVRAARIVLATGVGDQRPDIPGFEAVYGKHVFHCPCCDGYESRDLDVVAIGWERHSAGYALDLLDWGARVTLVTNGNVFEGDSEYRAALADHDIEIVEDKVVEFLAEEDRMTGVVLASGRRIKAQRAFFSIGHDVRNDLANSLGCATADNGHVKVGDHGETSVEGVYAVGDITPGEQLVAVAAAEGVIAGIACAMSLRGSSTAPGAPDPGPDPNEALPH